LREAKSILVISPSWIGDAVMSLGALRSLKAGFPAARLTVLVRPGAEALYRGCEAVAETLRYDPEGEDRGLGGFLGAARRLREADFDVSVLFPNAFRAALLVWAARIPERWGYATDGRGALLSRPVPPAPRPFGRHQAYYYLDLIESLGIPARPLDHHLDLTADMEEQATRLLSARGWRPGEPLVGLHPGSTNSSAKRWNPERYAEVGDLLAASGDARVVVFGGPREIAMAERVRSRLRISPIFLAGKTSLAGLMGLLGRLSVLVTNDSGPMHLGSAIGVPTVAVFGPTDERETGPLGRNCRVVRRQVGCSPCLHKECPLDHRCMVLVEVGEVVDAARDLLEREAEPRAVGAASR
jgi:heptosyltransferase-2